MIFIGICNDASMQTNQMFVNWLKRLKLTIPFLKALYQYIYMMNVATLEMHVIYKYI